MVCRTARALLVCSVALCFVNTASVYGTTITVGAPTATGNAIFQAFDSALIIVDQKTGMVINITKGPDTGNIPVTVPGDTANTKAAKIATALGKLANVTKSAAAANVVSVNGTFLGIKGRDLGTGETTTIGLAANGDPPGMPFVALVGYSGTLTGGVYQASFGDSLFTATADLPYSTVLADSIADGTSLLSTLVSDMYKGLQADLPTALQSDLYLDSTNGLIDFVFPSAAVDPFAQNFTSDLATESDVGLTEATVTTAPEPSCLALLGVGIAGVSLLRRRRVTRV